MSHAVRAYNAAVKRASSLRRVVSLLVIAGLGLSASADAGRRKKKRSGKDVEVVDVSARAAELQVYGDGEGTYVALVPNDTELLFAGDGKTLYRQRVYSASFDGTDLTWSLRFWAPRIGRNGFIAGSVDKVTLFCDDDEISLTRLAPAEAAKLVAGATFRRELWKRQAHRLSRDDRGVYYYVDRLRDEYGGKGWRLFAGMQGAMKQLPLTNIVDDSRGQIFASKKGDLRFVGDAGGAAQWIKGDVRVELLDVPVEDNVELIYSDLGVYAGSLGTPCDEY